MKNRDLPAFPISEDETDRLLEGVGIFTGLTKREYFTAKAMNGLCAGRTEHENPEIDLDIAINLADSLLEKLEQE